VGPREGINEITILKDKSLESLDWGVIGANERDYHIVGVEVSELPFHEIVDLAEVAEGDLCPQCGSPLRSFTGLEVGHIFRLGTRYSEPWKLSIIPKMVRGSPLLWVATESVLHVWLVQS